MRSVRSAVIARGRYAPVRKVPVIFARLLIAGLLLSATPVAAQDSSDTQAWLAITAHGEQGDLIYYAELQPRFGAGISEFDQLLVRPAIGWRLSPAVSIYQGYAYVETVTDTGRTREDRSFQQLNLDLAKIGRGELSGRTRLEQRWRSDGVDTAWRARQQLRYDYPLGPGERAVKAVVHGELFWNLNSVDWGARSGFDRARGFVGVQLPLSGESSADIGYMNQTADAPGVGTEIDHIVSISLTLRP